MCFRNILKLSIKISLNIVSTNANNNKGSYHKHKITTGIFKGFNRDKFRMKPLKDKLKT